MTFSTPLPRRAWVLQERTGTGMMVVAPHDGAQGAVTVPLCRIDQASGIIFLWDKFLKREVAVKIGELFPARLVV